MQVTCEMRLSIEITATSFRDMLPVKVGSCCLHTKMDEAQGGEETNLMKRNSTVKSKRKI